MTDRISEVFDITPMQRDRSITTMIDTSDDTVSSDSVLARQNIRDLIKVGMDALEDSIEVAKQQENPRAFEVAFAAMKTLADINMTLIDIHEKEQKSKQGTTQQSTQGPTNVTNNIAFVGTTKDLNAMIATRIEALSKGGE